MKIINFKFKKVNSKHIELRYFVDNPNDFKRRILDVKEEIESLIKSADLNFFIRWKADLKKTGKDLFSWLDGSDRFFSKIIHCYRENARILILAFHSDDVLSDLPWEILHNDEKFLVEETNPRFVPVRFRGDELSIDHQDQAAERPLRLLFMATSPVYTTGLEFEGLEFEGLEFEGLEFEDEEYKILKATEKQPLMLTVEESGNLEELNDLILTYGKNFYDIFHLTGHAVLKKGKPFFLTETEYGESHLADSREIGQALVGGDFINKLIVLSGCCTAKKGMLPSLAESILVECSANAVLGWGYNVLDADASFATAELYKNLSAGIELIKALSMTYQKLIDEERRDWNLLRLYLRNKVPGAFVTASSLWKEQAAPAPLEENYLDPEQTVKVASCREFVGRRRLLQKCLRCLKSLRRTNDHMGVILYGLGGVGKSTLAARLRDRLNFKKSIVWVGMVDENSLIQRIRENLDGKIRESLDSILSNPSQNLEYKLKDCFEKIHYPILLIFDNFESNFEMEGNHPDLNRNGSPSISIEAQKVIEAVIFALRDLVGKSHRIIITTRQLFNFNERDKYFLLEQPKKLEKANFIKKTDQLAEEKGLTDRLDREKGLKDYSNIKRLRKEADKISDGNPRLIEWLYDLLSLQDKNLDYDHILNRMKGRQSEFLENILAGELLKSQSSDLRKTLALGLIYELPVPIEALRTICRSIPELDIPELDIHIKRANELGLIERHKGYPGSTTELYRVPRCLSSLLISEIPSELIENIHCAASKILNEIWLSHNTSEEREKEVHRLALAGKEIELSINIAKKLSYEWDEQERYKEIEDLCLSTLKSIEDLSLNTLKNGVSYHELYFRLAIAQGVLGEYKLAKDNYILAIKSCPEWDRKCQAKYLKCLGSLCNTQGDLANAEKYCTESLQIRNDYGGTKREIAESLHAVGNVFANQGKIKEALEKYHQSFKMKLVINDKRGMAESIHALAYYIAKLNCVTSVLALYKKALKLNEEANDILGRASNLNQMARIHAKNNETEKAKELSKESFNLSKSVGDIRGIVESRKTEAFINSREKDFDEAMESCKKALKIVQDIGDEKEENIIEKTIEYIELKQGIPDDIIDKKYNINDDAYRTAQQIITEVI
ncbi:tetratricopeptide repeat protein [uncultured Desulfobacter sp.]|uniref:tetratricopeptide repeat protein n=1 Tax=uncultured Desulfobacter sp. TaxID=240139 RepID=UPI0029C6CDCD|nr:tetratricopeptide repeat protein [uncultured Desulfobacter sp.]